MFMLVYWVVLDYSLVELLYICGLVNKLKHSLVAYHNVNLDLCWLACQQSLNLNAARRPVCDRRAVVLELVIRIDFTYVSRHLQVLLVYLHYARPVIVVVQKVTVGLQVLDSVKVA